MESLEQSVNSTDICNIIIIIIRYFSLNVVYYFGKFVIHFNKIVWEVLNIFDRLVLDKLINYNMMSSLNKIEENYC